MTLALLSAKRVLLSALPALLAQAEAVQPASPTPLKLWEFVNATQISTRAVNLVSLVILSVVAALLPVTQHVRPVLRANT